MFPLTWSTKLKTIYRLKVSKKANFDTLSINTLYIYVYTVCIMVGGYSQGGGGQLPKGRGGANAPSHPPPKHRCIASSHQLVGYSICRLIKSVLGRVHCTLCTVS